ncbi:MAG: indole-3-glycerol phosphate synthase, partial [Lachnospiraceae bacterium]|nr:indole-3-glycerol phosphate synthase [Lachnospiraceae bacterium]
MILDEIVADKRKRLLEQKSRVPEQEMRRMAEGEKGESRSFYHALKKPGISIIGEFKQASPSLGKIESKMNLTERIKEYSLSVD